MKPKILIIDDDFDFSDSLKNVLEDILDIPEYEFMFANNGKIALEIMKEDDIDLLILDLHMPLMDGFTFMNNINNVDRFSGVPVIAISGTNDDNEIIEALKLGIEYYFVKPLMGKTLTIFAYKCMSLIKDRIEHKKLSQILNIDINKGINNKTIFEEVSYLLNELKQKNSLLKHYASPFNEVNYILGELNKKNNIIKEYTTSVEDLIQKKNEELQTETHNSEDDNLHSTSLIAEASHEIRTPLHIINSHINKTLEWLSMLLSGSDKIFNKQKYEPCNMKICKKQLELIERSYERLTAASNNSAYLRNIVEDLLDLSEISNNKMKLNLQSFNFHKLVSDVINECSVYYLVDPVNKKKKDVDIRYDVTTREITTDERKIRRLLLNLISNAMKFTSTGFISISADINKTVLSLKIEDSGIGIPIDAQNKIFDTFYKVENYNRNTIKGTGLGLTIVKKIVEFLDGNITMDSTPDVGTTFHIQLPLHQHATNYRNIAN